jgi:hypothetical protein
MSVREYVELYNRHKNNITKFCKYHKLGRDIELILLNDLYTSRASELGTYSVTSAYKRIFHNL